MLTYELTFKDSLSPEWHYTLSIEDAKKIASHLKNFSKGSFAYVRWLKPIRSAMRKKETEITIKTSGLDAREFFQILCDVAGGFENTQEVDRLDEDFTNWLTANFEYSGEGIDGENYWLSKSDADFLAFSYDGKLVKFIDLISDFYLTCDERIHLLDELLEEARELMKKAHQSEVIMEYYLSKIESL